MRNTAPPTLAETILGIYFNETHRPENRAIRNRCRPSNMLNLLTANKIMDMAGLDKKFSPMLGNKLMGVMNGKTTLVGLSNIMDREIR